MRIIVAEDETRISAFIKKGLVAEGIQVILAQDGVSALAAALSEQADLMILDVGLPLLDGFSVLKKLRESGSDLPVIILTARDSAQDTIRGLEIGANDYMSKPFSFGELLARIRLRVSDGARETPSSKLQAGQLVLDVERRQAHYRGKVHDLSAREFSLLRVLCEHHGKVLSPVQLLEHVWELDFDPGSNVVNVYIRYLRQKLGAEAIETIRGMGYRLVT
ncbi:MAG: response regulator transcription factor [Actinomycetaceae bacterium]|nr:response regulator transcription factor [Actinomycetaceae bacterium]